MFRLMFSFLSLQNRSDASLFTDRVPCFERRGCKTYFDAFVLFTTAWLRGHVGVYVQPGENSDA